MKLGIMGTNWITDSFIEGAINSGEWNLTAVYSRTEEKARAFGEKYGELTYFTDIEEMGKSDALDAVYIASPNALHYQHAVSLLKNKKHVIVEKPIFSTVAELEHAHQIARENNVFLFEAARHIQEPNFKRLQENIEKVGTIHGATLAYMKYSSRYDQVLNGEEPNIFSLKFSGGSIVDLGVYPLYSAITLFGEPVKATYFATKLPTGVDGLGPIILEYPTFNITIIQGKNSQSFLPSEIYGQKGTLIVDPLTGIEKITFYDNATKEETELAGPVVANDMQFEAAEFARIIEQSDRDTYKYLADLSLKVLRVSNELRHQNDIWFDAEK
ncbi:TPA_asm: gfo/Idh/MocA family oxidoreductase [Listeria monocytogenes]|uniref:Gfo/Idh/MocA family oxidoreductase n=1 Tax=Listeria monocytogenes TaxID=1639 RepID=A0A6Z2TP80_LISMN|nr:Gfo/Idh/MocA family oxidoreductase [Listeria monocytogenes]EAD3613528.1 gfo/Idh/MocA family oxidoreductase [Listeria monocytogenes]EAD3636027.1 gfo/Idh/MocA family oxidoreductase [Listeria monocytogenes]EAD3636415.1 gfo/Idh/MocA family oxidoreductase [Listeria monocytogenes]EAD3641485.1 gfo/Idh/MocA family oxidoreductase [Listeria monocytogenes]EAD5499104.1 Gfo/Idh/MocA family oxidoreductase [Listeria monocytogenes]